MSALNFDPLGDGNSLLEYVDHMGDDNSIVRSARVSYANDKKEFSDERDEKLIKYLINNEHWSPFESCYITFHIACPIFVARQWHRHLSWNFNLNINEVSRRYTSEDIRVYYPGTWREQATKNKQSSEGSIKHQTWVNHIYDDSVQRAMTVYNDLLDKGVSREQARMVLPQSIYTRFYATCSLRSAIHFYGLRVDKHSQWEIQQYAHAMDKILSKLFPVTWTSMIYSKENI